MPPRSLFSQYTSHRGAGAGRMSLWSKGIEKKVLVAALPLAGVEVMVLAFFPSSSLSSRLKDGGRCLLSREACRADAMDAVQSGLWSR